MTKLVSEDGPCHCTCVPLIVGSEDEDDEEWEGEGLGIEECLFCSSISSSLENNINHMSVKHGFFLPDADYLVDVEGMVTYLGMFFQKFILSEVNANFVVWKTSFFFTYISYSVFITYAFRITVEVTPFALCFLSLC